MHDSKRREKRDIRDSFHPYILSLLTAEKQAKKMQKLVSDSADKAYGYANTKNEKLVLHLAEQLCRKALSPVRNAADRAFRRKRAVGFGKAVDFQIAAHDVHSFAADKGEYDFHFGKRRNAFHAVDRDVFPLFDTN